MGRAARNNPVAVAAKKGEIKPKEKPLSKREQDRRLQAHVQELLMREMIHPDPLNQTIRKGDGGTMNNEKP